MILFPQVQIDDSFLFGESSIRARKRREGSSVSFIEDSDIGKDICIIFLDTILEGLV